MYSFFILSHPAVWASHTIKDAPSQNVMVIPNDNIYNTADSKHQGWNLLTQSPQNLGQSSWKHPAWTAIQEQRSTEEHEFPSSTILIFLLICHLIPLHLPSLTRILHPLLKLEVIQQAQKWGVCKMTVLAYSLNILLYHLPDIVYTKPPTS